MKALIIYDSQFGNTEKIAKAIARGIGENVEVKNVNDASINDIKGVELLIVGSPTHGGQATPAIQNFLKSLPDNLLKGVKVSAFDTRSSDEGKAWLKIIINIFKFPAPRMAKVLQAKDGNLAAEPEGFIVKGKEGPLIEGELERAEKWGKKLLI
ncbi:MAG: flavodoxin family protein [Patescibacteria group bacterium]|jgi:flavodoxin